MPPCTSRDERLDVPLAKSSFSSRATRHPRIAASLAIPHPVIPPPMMSRSNVSRASVANALARARSGGIAPEGVWRTLALRYARRVFRDHLAPRDSHL